MNKVSRWSLACAAFMFVQFPVAVLLPGMEGIYVIVGATVLSLVCARGLSKALSELPGTPAWSSELTEDLLSYKDVVEKAGTRYPMPRSIDQRAMEHAFHSLRTAVEATTHSVEQLAVPLHSFREAMGVDKVKLELMRHLFFQHGSVRFEADLRQHAAFREFKANNAIAMALQAHNYVSEAEDHSTKLYARFYFTSQARGREFVEQLAYVVALGEGAL